MCRYLFVLLFVLLFLVLCVCVCVAAFSHVFDARQRHHCVPLSAVTRGIVFVCACVRVCVCACVRVRVRACAGDPLAPAVPRGVGLNRRRRFQHLQDDQFVICQIFQRRTPCLALRCVGARSCVDAGWRRDACLSEVEFRCVALLHGSASSSLLLGARMLEGARMHIRIWHVSIGVYRCLSVSIRVYLCLFVS